MSSSEYYNKMSKTASYIYGIYRDITKFEPVSRETDGWDEELVLAYSPYKNNNFNHNIDTLTTFSRDFEDKQNFQILIDYFYKLEQVQKKYSNIVSSLSHQSQDNLFELERAHWNDIGDLLKAFQITFDKLFTKIDKELTFDNVRREYLEYLNADFY